MHVQRTSAYVRPNWLWSLNLAPRPGRLLEKLIAGGVAAIVTASRRYRRSGVTGPVAERQADNQEKSVVAWGTA